jgi:hypothetical protein
MCRLHLWNWLHEPGFESARLLSLQKKSFRMQCRRTTSLYIAQGAIREVRVRVFHQKNSRSSHPDFDFFRTLFGRAASRTKTHELQMG